MTVLVVRGEAAAAVQLHEHATRLLDACGGRLGLVVVGDGRLPSGELSVFTGIPAFGDIPFDGQAAGVASGDSGSALRLERSTLWAGTGRLAGDLAVRVAAERGPGRQDTGIGATGEHDDGSPAREGVAAGGGSTLSGLRHRLGRIGHRSDRVGPAARQGPSGPRDVGGSLVDRTGAGEGTVREPGAVGHRVGA